MVFPFSKNALTLISEYLPSLLVDVVVGGVLGLEQVVVEGEVDLLVVSQGFADSS